MADKRYYWLKLKDDFFNSKRIKKMRKIAGGDTLTIIYLKMQLVAMKHDGVIAYTGVEPSIAEEIALDIDEDVDNVKMCLSYLLGCGLAEECGKGCFLPYSVENVGSEGSAAERMRRSRANAKSIECNIVTPMLRDCYTEKEKEKDTDTEKEKKKKKPGGAADVDQILEEFCIDDPVKEAVREFVKMRKLIKAPMTDRALKLMINKLREMTLISDEQIEILNQSIENSWKGIFPVRKDNRSKAADSLNETYTMMDAWANGGE